MTTTATGHGSVAKHHHKRHLSRSSSSAAAADGSPPGNALINELGGPANMFVTENGTVVTSQIGGTAILPCATAKLGTATVSARGYTGRGDRFDLNFPVLFFRNRVSRQFTVLGFFFQTKVSVPDPVLNVIKFRVLKPVFS